VHSLLPKWFNLLFIQEIVPGLYLGPYSAANKSKVGIFTLTIFITSSVEMSF